MPIVYIFIPSLVTFSAALSASPVRSSPSVNKITILTLLSVGNALAASLIALPKLLPPSVITSGSILAKLSLKAE